MLKNNERIEPRKPEVEILETEAAVAPGHLEQGEEGEYEEEVVYYDEEDEDETTAAMDV